MAKTKNGTTAANIGFEAPLWQAADKLRTNMDAAGGLRPAPASRS